MQKKLIGVSKLLTEHYSFFGIKVPKSGRLCKSKLARKAVLEHAVIGNLRLLSEGVGAQLCTTALGRKHGVNPQTIANIIKDLIKRKIIRCTNSDYLKGSHAKTYEVNWHNAEAVAILNIYSGFDQNEEKYVKAVKKRMRRRKNWIKFDPLTYEWEDVVRLAFSYIGCPDQFFEDIKRHVPIEILCASRESNILQPRIYDFWYAFRWATKQVNAREETQRPYKCPRGIKEWLGKDVNNFELEYNFFNNDDEMIEKLDKFNGFFKNAFTRRWAILQSIGRKFDKFRMKEIKKHLDFIDDFEDCYEDPIGKNHCEIKDSLVDYKLKKETEWWLNWRNVEKRSAA